MTFDCIADSARAEVSLELNGVACVTCFGVLTRHSLSSLCPQVFRQELASARGWLVQMEPAILAFSEQDLLQADFSSRECVPSTIAIVVSAVSEEMMRGYAWRAGRRGLLRAVFTSSSTARAWLARQLDALPGRTPA